MKTPALISAVIIMAVTLAALVPHRSNAGNIPRVLLPVADSPLITFRIQFRVGSIDDPEGKKGLTRLTTSMLTNAGTRSHSYDEIIDQLYPMAAHVDARVDKEMTTIIGTVHIDNLDEYYELLREIVLEPRFDERDFDRVRTNQVNYLTKTLRSSDDEELGKEALNAFMYEGHPYGHPIEGRAADVRAATLDDVRQHYQRFFTRHNVTIGLAGGYDEDLLDRLEEDLNRLPDTVPPTPILPRPRPIHQMPVIVVEKECRATAVSMGFPIDVTRSDQDFYALMIANSYLGEHRTFNGRLMVRMRQIRGLNYGDYSYVENFIQQGGSTFPVANIPRQQQFFSIWIRPVQHKHRQFAIRLALWELENMVSEGIGEADFEATRKFLINYSRLWAQDQSRRLGYRMDSVFYGTEDLLQVLPKKLAAITRDQVNEAIRRYLNFENIQIAVVTSGADEFMTVLVSNAPSPIVYETDDIGSDVISEDKLVAVYKMRVNRADSRIVDVGDMFE